MKVVGTGGPHSVTLRLEPCERDVLLDELRRHRSAAIEAVSELEARRSEQASAELDERHYELVVLARVMDQIENFASDAESIELLGPTWLMHDVIRGAAAAAVEGLTTVARDFQALDPPRPTPAQLQAAVAVAAAWTQTLVDYDYVDSHDFE